VKNMRGLKILFLILFSSSAFAQADYDCRYVQISSTTHVDEIDFSFSLPASVSHQIGLLKEEFDGIPGGTPIEWQTVVSGSALDIALALRPSRADSRIVHYKADSSMPPYVFLSLSRGGNISFDSLQITCTRR
jgi:hypothetical protein